MADLKIYADVLKDVSDSDQRRIEEILKNTGLLDAQEHVVAQTGDSDELDFRIRLPRIPRALCKLGCNAAEAAAIAACAALTGPAAAACIIAAHAGADRCRSKCR
jgi:hypothetical protein